MMGSGSMPNTLARFPRRAAWRRGLATVHVAVLACAISACGLLDGESPATSTSVAENGVIRVGILATVDNAPVKLAEKRGFFRKYGLDVEITVFRSGPEALTEVAGGKLDVCLINYVSFFQAISKKTVDGRVIADAYQATPDSVVLMARPEAGILTPADLPGKKISVHAPGNINELLLRAMLKNNDLDPGSPSYLPIAFPNIQAALNAREIDAGVMVEPYITQAEQQIGAVPALKLAVDATADMPMSGYVALTVFTRDHPEKVAAFQRGIRDANDLANNDRASLTEVLPDLAKVPADNVGLLNLGKFPTSVESARLQRVLDLMSTYGGLPSGLDAKNPIIPMPGA
jgi:NitT/TauT family transport system substrate-binding protein